MRNVPSEVRLDLERVVRSLNWEPARHSLGNYYAFEFVSTSDSPVRRHIGLQENVFPPRNLLQ